MASTPHSGINGHLKAQAPPEAESMVCELQTSAAQLLAELNVLEQRHHSERDRFIGAWFDRHQKLLLGLRSSDDALEQLSPPAYSFREECVSDSDADLQIADTIVNVPCPDPLSRGVRAELASDQIRRITQDMVAIVPSGSVKRFASGEARKTTSTPSVKGAAAASLASREASASRLLSDRDLTTQTTTNPSNPMKKPSLSRSRMLAVLADVKETKKKKKTKRPHSFRLMETNLSGPESLLTRFTRSRMYEVSSGTLIVLNAIYIGYQTQFKAEQTRDWRQGSVADLKAVPAFIVMQTTFCVFFTLELSVRWIADGLVDFFRSAEQYWNFFDIFVVIFSWVDIIIVVIISEEDKNGAEMLSNVSLLRVLRVVRIVRVAKVIRVMRFFRELRMMVFSILGSIKSLLWSMMVLGLCFFVFGISLTSGCTELLETTQDQDWDVIKGEPVLKYFGTLDNSMLTLFLAITGGNDWGMYYEALTVLPYQYRIFFMVFMFFSIFAVLNIVTGVFVESAMLSGTTDREIMVHEEMEAKRSYQDSMREFFEEADEDGTGNISYDEFTKKLNDERVIAYFNAFKLDVSDASLLFNLLDYDQSGEIQIDEFLDGCYRLQGESRALDMKVMQLEVRFLKEAFILLSDQLSDILPFFDILNGSEGETDSQKVSQLHDIEADFPQHEVSVHSNGTQSVSTASRKTEHYAPERFSTESTIARARNLSRASKAWGAADNSNGNSAPREAWPNENRPCSRRPE